jgi:hypothetical protein
MRPANPTLQGQLTCLAAAMVRLAIDLTRFHAMQVDTKII